MANKKKHLEETIEEMEAVLNPESKRIVRLLDNAIAAMTIPDYEAILAENDRQADEAWKRLTVTMRDEFRRADEERRRIWGKKFPRFVGEKPSKPEPKPETGKPKKPKTSRKPQDASEAENGTKVPTKRRQRNASVRYAS